MNCKDCKWWGEKRDAYYGGKRRCEHEGVNSFNCPDNGMHVDDGEPFNAGSIYTGPLFGCVLFEATSQKEEK